jgi:hypothetical protein
MQLSFLGNSYTVSSPVTDVTETQPTLSFLGRKAHVKQHHIARHQPTGEALTFMGRRYSR